MSVCVYGQVCVRVCVCACVRVCVLARVQCAVCVYVCMCVSCLFPAHAYCMCVCVQCAYMHVCVIVVAAVVTPFQLCVALARFCISLSDCPLSVSE